MTKRKISPEEAKLADALRYLRAFPNAPAAQQTADELLRDYSIEACNQARGRSTK